MKSYRPHRVPLCDDAIAVLKLQAGQDAKFIFPGYREGHMISTAAMPELMKEFRPDVTCHGMRSSFRTWAAERTSFPREVIETALAHVNRDKTEAAYLHSDHLEKRIALMSQWALHCSTNPKKAMVTKFETNARQ